MRYSAHQAAREAVAPGVEGRPGDQYVRPPLGQRRPKGRFRGLALLVDVAIAADQRSHDVSLAGQPSLEGAAGASRAWSHLDRMPGLLFAADPGKELVQVMDDAHLGVSHGRTPLLRIRNRAPAGVWQRLAGCRWIFYWNRRPVHSEGAMCAVESG